MEANEKLNSDQFLVYNLGRLEGQLSGIGQKLDEFLKRFDDHELRINELESKSDKVSVFKTLPTVFLSGFIALAITIIGKIWH